MGKRKFKLNSRKGVKIAKTAVVEETAKIGKGTVVWNFAQIMHNACIGKNCVIGNGAYIDRNVIVGDNVKIHNKALIYRGIKIGNNCFIGPGACFANDKNPRSFKTRSINKPKWHIKESASIGANAVILPDVSIGKYAMIGAGAIVTKDVKDHCLVAGNPAVLEGYVCKCGMKLKGINKNYYCSDCKKYVKI
jgi:UDP-2-acetamido-3-amino-2,3-dideoxy-glucuronate N-acetyltransferase